MCSFTYSWRNSCCSSVVDEFDSLFNDTAFSKNAGSSWIL